MAWGGMRVVLDWYEKRQLGLDGYMMMCSCAYVDTYECVHVLKKVTVLQGLGILYPALAQ